MNPTRKIITEFVYPPIPLRSFDWQAVEEGYEPGDPIGRGPSEDEAILDLEEQIGSLWAGYEDWLDVQAAAWDEETDR